MEFLKHAPIRNVIQRISKHFNVDIEKIVIVINALTPKNNEILSDCLKGTNTTSILVMVKQ